MQLARIVFPEPGDPLKRKPRLGGSLLTALYYASLMIEPKSSDYILYKASCMPPSLSNL